MVTATDRTTANLPDRQTDAPDRLIRSSLGRSAVIVAAAITLYVAVTTSLANALSERNPAFVIDYLGQNSTALENLADAQIVADARRGGMANAVHLARTAIRRDGTSVKAFRVIGISEGLAGNEERADALFTHADALTRRDLGTRLLLIEQAVARNDIPGTLRHYDLALRTSRSSFDLLAPVLSSAISDDGLRGPIAQAFRANPPWLPAFLDYAIANTPAPANLAQIMLLSRHVGPVNQPETVLMMTNRLIAEGHYRAAQSFLAAMVPNGRELFDGLLRDPRFSEPGDFAPFAWTIADSLNVGATSQPDGLSYFARPDQSGQVARQLLTLPPGTYQLVTVANNVSVDPFGRAQWTLRCAGERGRQVTALALPQGDEPRSALASFTIPNAGCAGQWLELILRAGEDPAGLEGRVRTVEIRRASRER